MTSEPRIEVELRLTGDGFLPDRLTSVVQIVPTKTWRFGDSVQGTALRRKNDGWAYGLPPRESYEVEALLRELMDAIEPSRDRIIDAMKQFRLEASISFGIYISTRSPACWFSAESIGRIAALGAGLDVDVIIS